MNNPFAIGTRYHIAFPYATQPERYGTVTKMDDTMVWFSLEATRAPSITKPTYLGSCFIDYPERDAQLDMSCYDVERICKGSWAVSCKASGARLLITECSCLSK